MRVLCLGAPMTDLSPLAITRALPRVAVLIDGDNVPFSVSRVLEAQAKSMGQVVIRRVYGDMGLRKDWAAAAGYDAYHCASGPVKNHADIRLVIGALDLAHRGLAQGFVIMSDDRDFTPLVNHLREIGLQAEQVGKPKAAPKLVTSLSPVDADLKALLSGKPKGLPLKEIGGAMQGMTVKDRTGKTTWRAYVRSKPDLFALAGSGQDSRVLWCGG